jgi:hypothetical protein
MQVYLDDKPLNGCDTFAQALRTASDRAQQAGRVIVEAYLDGAAVSEAVLERPPDEALGGELRLTSVEPRALVRVTLMDAADALDTARQDQMRCADLIQTGKVEESLAPLSSAIQTWQAVRDAVEKSAALLRMPLDSVSLPGSVSGTDTLIGLIAALSGRLEEVKRSLAMEDWSALADVLAYDMAEQAARWRQVLVALAESLKTEG